MGSLHARLQIAIIVSAGVLLSEQVCAQNANSPLGIFEGHDDVGTILHPGAVDYDATKKTYTISGSGENMWLAADAFQFVWKKVSGDVTLTADISFLTTTGNENKKAALMLRQSLEPDSVYVDVALHASGLTSLQFRDEKGAITREIQSNILAPKRLRIAKRGDYVYMSLAADGGEPESCRRMAAHSAAGGRSMWGWAVCSHDRDKVEKAEFANVELTQPAPGRGGKVGALQHARKCGGRFGRPAGGLSGRAGRFEVRTGCTMGARFCSIATGILSGSRWAVTSPR